MKTTFEPDNEYTPWLATDLVVNVQPDGGASIEQNRTVGEVKLFPVAAVSFAFTLMVWVAPTTPLEVSATATAGVMYVELTTPFVPTARVETFETSDVAAVLSLVEPEPPEATVVDATVCTPVSANRTL